MRLTFPHMGTMSIVLKTLFTALGCQVFVAPPISKRTLDLGVMHSPEGVCLPFKVTLGNFIESLEQGADTLVTCGGVGPCRLGYYAEVQRAILRQLGYKFEMIIAEPDLFDAIKNLRKVAPDKNIWQIYRAFHLAGAKMSSLDDIERKVCFVRPREKLAGTADALWDKAKQALDEAATVAEVKAVTAEALQSLERVKRKEGFVPLKVGIVGEIYVSLEPAINLDIERRLGSIGVEVHKTMYLSDYVRGHLLRKREYLKLFRTLFALAKPYLGHYVGGHGLKSIGHTVHMAQQGYDGIVQVYPFSCMPEVIAKNILPTVSKDVDMPVLTLAYDEQSGEAGLVTRLEAFIDLLKYRRKKAAAQ